MAEGRWCGFSEEELSRIRLVEESKHDGIHCKVQKSSLKTKGATKRNSLAALRTLVNADSTANNFNTTVDKTCHVDREAVTANELVRLRIDEDGRVLEVVQNKNSDKNGSEEWTDDNHKKHLKSVANDLKNDCLEGSAMPIIEIKEKLDSKDLSNLEKFQTRQKLMEEQNKQRRALLTQAILNRQKKTQEENDKLLHIQKEMLKIDSLVSSDVAILRNHIEQASMEFNEAQKRYKKAEEEFVQAKVELFRRLNRKEQLTEHLCAIIEQNELRKGEKLVNLMQELDMEVIKEEWNEEKGSTLLPQLCWLNDNMFVSSTIKESHGNAVDQTLDSQNNSEHNDTVHQSLIAMSEDEQQNIKDVTITQQLQVDENGDVDKGVKFTSTSHHDSS